MSLGYGGKIEFIAKDRNTALYNYGSFNWNKKTESDDGEIEIDRQKLKEAAWNQKGSCIGITDDLISSGAISVQNASNTWSTTESGADWIAVRLLDKVVEQFRGTFCFVEEESLFC